MSAVSPGQMYSVLLGMPPQHGGGPWKAIENPPLLLLPSNQPGLQVPPGPGPLLLHAVSITVIVQMPSAFSLSNTLNGPPSGIQNPLNGAVPVVMFCQPPVMKLVLV